MSATETGPVRRVALAAVARGFLSFVVAQTLTRMFFLAWSWAPSASLADVLAACAAGLRFDAAVALVLSAPVALLVLGKPRLVVRSAWSWRVVGLVAVIAAGFLDALHFGYFGARFDARAWDFLTDVETVRLVLVSLPAEVPLLPAALALVALFVLAWLVDTRLLGTRPLGWRGFVVVLALTVAGVVGLLSGGERYTPFLRPHVLVNAAQDNPFFTLWRARGARARLAGVAADPRGIVRDEALTLAAQQIPGAVIDATGRHLERVVSDDRARLVRRPRHVVLIVMESLSAWPVEEEELGFGAAMAPELRELAANSLWFTSHFATDGGTLINLHELLLSEAKPFDGTSLRVTDAAGTPRTLPQWMKQLGFAPTFHYGGDYAWLDVGNRLRTLGFESLRAGRASPVHGLAHFGLHDDELFEKVAADLRAADAPSFHVVLTSSNHPPFEVPADFKPRAFYLPPRYRPRVKDQSQLRARLVAFQYADRALGRFFRAIRDDAFFADTLFVLVGDHPFPSTVRPEPSRALVKNRVPLLLHAPGLLAERDRRFTHFTSHRDVLPTLVGMLAPGSRVRTWGKSLFDESVRPVVLSPNLVCFDATCLVHAVPYEMRGGLVLGESAVAAPPEHGALSRALRVSAL